MLPITLLFSHLILIIILHVSLLIILFSSSVRLYIFTNKLILRAVIFALIIELIASILIVWGVKPALQVQPAVYDFSFKYLDYSQEWIDSSPTEAEKLCIANYLKNTTYRNEKCKDPVDAYIRQAEVFNLTGNGIAYLECNTNTIGRKCEGIALYEFPSSAQKERFPVIMNINVEFIPNNEILVRFRQETTYIDLGKRIIKRPGDKFKITAKRKGNSDEFIGEFKHPNREILLAKFSVCTSYECRK